MSVKAVAAAIVAALALSLPGVALAQAWSYTDGSGKTVSLDHVPTRIVAHANAAAGLIALGIRPVGIYVDSPVADDKSLEGLDLTGIEIVGEAWGEINVEKTAALKPDLIVAEWWPLDNAWSGLNDKLEQVSKIAPVTGPAQGASIVTLIEDYEKLAASLGADLSAPEVAADKKAFEDAREKFKAALAAKPNLNVLAVWAGTDALYVAATAGAAELSDFASWGMKLVDPAVADDRGYWETLSWEQADKYQPDLVIVDNRSATTIETAKDQPMWTAIRAAAAGQVTDWPAFWLRNYKAYAGALDKLTTAIAAADENLGD
ncbi:ABC transporter substrate-binding protein [Devosia sp. ZB163]|uniref:ABC transporter substrate-binding protein n=1 Tax=Devosia sp. ZB163 TaxID=3025938 RepID=UPI0023629B42|nr:ABC transporter substrate-binding protein [Devosia sp. ZB163]MDC9824336.1 ABC transporter substrate-binding protein [Devosia sp. ZB163]